MSVAGRAGVDVGSGKGSYEALASSKVLSVSKVLGVILSSGDRRELSKGKDAGS